MNAVENAGQAERVRDGLSDYSSARSPVGVVNKIVVPVNEYVSVTELVYSEHDIVLVIGVGTHDCPGYTGIEELAQWDRLPSAKHRLIAYGVRQRTASSAAAPRQTAAACAGIVGYRLPQTVRAKEAVNEAVGEARAHIVD
jgi:hypothetical protein